MKLVLCVLAALMVMCLLAKLAGGAWLSGVAFTLPFVGWPLTWCVLLFFVALACCWRVAKGK